MAEAQFDARGGVGDFAGHELETAARALVVEQNSGDCVQAEALAVVHRDPVAVDLRDAVRAARIERRDLALRALDDLAEHFARAGLIEARFRRRLLHRFEHARDAKRGELAGEDGLIPRRLHEALRGEVVDLVGFALANDVGQRRLVEQVRGHELDAVDEVRDALVGRRGAATHRADDAVALGEQEFGEVRSVLAGDAGDECGR